MLLKGSRDHVVEVGRTEAVISLEAVIDHGFLPSAASANKVELPRPGPDSLTVSSDYRGFPGVFCSSWALERSVLHSHLLTNVS